MMLVHRSKRVLALAAVVSASSSIICEQKTHMEPAVRKQPAFISSKSVKGKKADAGISIKDMVLISGTAHPELAKDISSYIGVPLADAEIKRFSDGEVSVQINHNLRGKDVFIIQSCAAPVNDSIMELLLTVSCVRRSSARRVIAVVPYFGYKHHRRGAPISTKHNSRFLFSSSMAFAKMLQEMGVDRVIAVDLQRPGQGSEACFFDNNVPLETMMSTDIMSDYLRQHEDLQDPIVVVTPNSECVKKARNVQLRLQEQAGEEVKLLAFFPIESADGYQDPTKLELLGKASLKGADIVIVDDMVDTAGTLTTLSERLAAAGARNIYVTASHGLFTERSMELIEKSPVKKVIVTNSLPLPKSETVSSKVVQLSMAPMLGNLILAEHFRSIDGKAEEFSLDD